MTHKLGEGTFSEVLKVKNKVTGKLYAMKRFRKRFSSTFEEIQNLREIQALRRLNPHPHTIQMCDIIFDQKHGALALTFELMDCNLYELICRKNSVMTESRAKNYFYQIMLGMEYMHSKGIFHRDIKPENILIKDNTIKLADFGSCRGIHSKQPYTEYIATRWYRSPECILCDGIYGYKMDLWGAGCVFYEILTKSPLFPGSNQLDQIHRIHNIVGTPSTKLLKRLLGSKGNDPDYNFAPIRGRGLAAIMPPVSPECIDVLEKLLIYDPDERISSKETLRHPFFREFTEERVYISPTTTSTSSFITTTLASPTRKPEKTKMEVVQISQPLKVDAIKKETSQSYKPAVMVKKELKMEESMKSVDGSPKPQNLSITHRKEPIITSTYIKAETSESHKHPVPPKEPVKVSKYVVRSSNTDSKVPVAMRRKTSKDYKENLYHRQPSLPKLPAIRIEPKPLGMNDKSPRKSKIDKEHGLPTLVSKGDPDKKELGHQPVLPSITNK